MRYLNSVALIFACLSFSIHPNWGFFGHKKITEMAIYTLPAGLMSFYKVNADLIIENSVAADRRRYVIEAEGPRHYIDLDEYDDIDSIPKYWYQAIGRYGEDTLLSRGIVPWAAYLTYKQLIWAYSDKNYHRIIRYASDLAHYLSDANVPLHTTSNYDGQKTDQNGVHRFWETRLPQLFSNKYDFVVGRANYIEDPQMEIWQAIFRANSLVDSLLSIEKETTKLIGESKKFAFEDKGKRTVKVFSEKYSSAYHNAMPKVELQMQRSIKLIGDFWFTAWVEAGQPDLLNLESRRINVVDSTGTTISITPQRQHNN